jgi:mannose/fructose/N-acetylgalactosamine-specific phosphotransferase system component IID
MPAPTTAVEFFGQVEGCEPLTPVGDAVTVAVVVMIPLPVSTVVVGALVGSINVPTLVVIVVLVQQSPYSWVSMKLDGRFQEWKG